MPVNNAYNFDQILPKHPHRRLHILISILAFVLVVWAVVYYQMNRVKVVVVPDSRDPDKVKQEKLEEMSRSLQIQEQTPEFQKKLAEMSASLNKK